MARKLRIEFPGAIYHVLNRGNYRRDLFEGVDAAEAFLRTLFETSGQFGWNIHAYVLMPNHFHLAIETPQPTLVEGMHWLQSTLAARFNRFRGEKGHLFQGRYKSLLVEDAQALSRVVDYIHLNPVRARIVAPEHVKAYRWSSLRAFMKGPRDPSMSSQAWLEARGGWQDDPGGWTAYESYLIAVGHDEARWEPDGLSGLSQGWAIGTDAWRKALAAEFSQMALSGGLGRTEARDLREAAWQKSFDSAMAEIGKSYAELETKPLRKKWKVELAERVRAETGASVSWLAQRLKIGQPGTLRCYLSRGSRRRRIKTTV
jgi:REP element-mobilizing transposase RayT